MLYGMSLLQICKHTGGEADDDYVFYNVLPLESGDKETLPCDFRQQKKWHNCHDHVRDEEYQCHLFHFGNDKENTDEYLPGTQKHYKAVKRYKRQGSVEQSFDKGIGWTEIKKLERTKPNKHNKQRKMCKHKRNVFFFPHHI